MKTRSSLAIVLSGLLLFTACASSLPFLGGDEEEEAVVARPVQTIERPTVKVVRGSIIDAVRVLGRVVAESEEALQFKQGGRLKGIYVQYNQEVVAGTLLADLETGDLETSIANSELSLEDLQRTLNKARTQATSGEADITIARVAVEQAERSLAEAREALAEARGGPTQAERAEATTSFTKAAASLAAAEDALKLAQEAYTKAQQDLEAFGSGAAVDLKVQRELAVRDAEDAFNTARTRVNQLKAGGTDSTILNLQRQLELAQNAVTRERQNLEIQIRDFEQKFKDAEGSSSRDSRAAGSLLWEINIRVCQLVGGYEPVELLGGEATKKRQCFAIAGGEVTHDVVDPVSAPLPNTHMHSLWLTMQAAQQNYDLAVAQSGGALPEAEANLDKARFNLDQARDALAEVGPDLERAVTTAKLDRDAKEAAVVQAQADLDKAQEGYDTVQAGVDSEKVRDAELAFASAEANLQKAQANYDLVLVNAADAGNVAKLENDLTRARANHNLLLERLADARMEAPFDGVIQFIKGKAGEPVAAYSPIIGLADPRKLIITADLSEDDTPKVALEQVADITLDAFSSEILKGTITKLPTSLVTAQGVIQDRSIRLEVDWPKEGAEIGMLARITITVQEKQNVLKVPIESIKRSGRRTFVEYMDGGIKRAKNVEIGIQTETEVEILSGVEEGFVILQGQ